MLIPKMIPHGERVNSYYAPLPGETAGLAGKSTNEDRKLGGGDGIVTRYQKHERAAWRPSALGWIKSSYAEAIEYTGLTKDLKGIAFIGAYFSVWVWRLHLSPAVYLQ